jgi:hypothetical protein
VGFRSRRRGMFTVNLTFVVISKDAGHCAVTSLPAILSVRRRSSWVMRVTANRSMGLMVSVCIGDIVPMV